MLKLILFIIVCANIGCLICYRKYQSYFEKVAYYNAIAGLIVLPVSIVGVFLSATNIQGIHGDTSIYGLVIFIWAITVLISLVAVVNLILKNIKNNLTGC
ncbi:hypothetical protein JAO78_000670 [Alishewanella sp. 16-MA]|uniref:Uncharacterized protein n=1 Tax=Alishewanella maricola TaxID=2795740 RepID=A0ABS8BZM7_9ALTE|nr:MULTISPECIES: hypothetical protein [Alishewanella]MDP4945415.1 hypothetical protein [Alishewanella sp.]MCB5225330.1 hypothetical protein [Alishewanella maricola]MDP5036886.1 hypothetical protein [Alishewanella sp.]MDP5187240.1 hypothetical protein [Alishewanella sp.]MDP5458778.1 hypothetical protein [Alishewanella sp. SMS8]